MFETNQLDILLVNLWHSSERALENFFSVHMGLRSLLAFLRTKGHTGKILFNHDRFLSAQQIFSLFTKEIIHEKPLFLGFSPYCSFPLKGAINDIRKIEKIVKKAKNKGIPSYIVLGGQFASFMHYELMRDFPWIDFIIRGEGEETLDELISAIRNKQDLKSIRGLTYRKKGKIVWNPARPNIKNLDTLPIPALDHLDFAKKNNLPKELVIMSTSRGCYGNCSFCSVQSFYHLSSAKDCTWRSRSPQKVVDEIELLSKKYNFRFFRILDNNFMGPGEAGKKRAQSIAKEIIRRGLKINFSIMCRANDIDKKTIILLEKAGLKTIIIGIESGSEEGLKTLSKGVSVRQNKKALSLLNEIGINVIITFIFIHPYSTLKEIKDNINFYNFTRSLKNVCWENEHILSHMWIYPGTPIKERLEKDGLLRGNYADGYTYIFKQKNLNFIKELSDIFSGAAGFLEALLYHISVIEQNQKKESCLLLNGLRRLRKKICNNFALDSLLEAVKILEGPRPEEIHSFLKSVKSELDRLINP